MHREKLRCIFSYNNTDSGCSQIGVVLFIKFNYIGYVAIKSVAYFV